GEAFVAELRAQRLEQPQADYAAHAQALTQACDAGCGVACYEGAHAIWESRESKRLLQTACTLGEAGACDSAETEAEALQQHCGEGRLEACQLLLSKGGEGQAALWAQVESSGSQACEALDARGCAAAAWARCAGAGTCDEQALAAADKATLLVPSPAHRQLLALVQCYDGQTEAADATLAQACSAGSSDDCERRCEALPQERSALVRGDERALWQGFVGIIDLQGGDVASWYPTLSSLDRTELARFAKLIETFTPPLSEAGAQAKVPAGLAEQYPVLVEALRRSPQTDAKKIKYWFGRIPQMTDEQRNNLADSLRNHWWMMPGEGTITPHAFVDLARGAALAGL
ncbi:MAG: hypothetical protein KC431_18935, partial [Myxococcales bacterium]|nr:hypothetical protein [Myxococcales bacterium]